LWKKYASCKACDLVLCSGRTPCGATQRASHLASGWRDRPSRRIADRRRRQIPSGTRPNRYAITAVGVTFAKEFVFSRSVEIMIERSDSPVSITVYPAAADFTMDQKALSAGHWTLLRQDRRGSDSIHPHRVCFERPGRCDRGFAGHRFARRAGLGENHGHLWRSQARRCGSRTGKPITLSRTQRASSCQSCASAGERHSPIPNPARAHARATRQSPTPRFLTCAWRR
jgi:hypothetical protein